MQSLTFLYSKVIASAFVAVVALPLTEGKKGEENFHELKSSVARDFSFDFGFVVVLFVSGFQTSSGWIIYS
jgi:hypothetical protein